MKMRALIFLRLLPQYLFTVNPPIYESCKAGSMTKRPWRGRGIKNKRQIKVVSKPGHCVSVDQIESRTPGFCGVLRGFITNRRYTCATIFTDHNSCFSYIHLQNSTSGIDIVAAKSAFEAYSLQYGVHIKHYHADNGRFADKDFLTAIHADKQTISFCAVNAHFQNGIAEKRNRELQEQAQTALLHSINKWYQVSSIHLWPYALHYCNDLRNHLPSKTSKISPIELYTDTAVLPKLNNFHSFGCPVFILDSAVQNNQSIPKWDSRCRIGLNLDLSPRHVRSVSLVLHLDTSRVSP